MSAFSTFRGQPVRMVLTISSIAIGIVAIVGAGGAAASLEHALMQEIAAAGSYAFVIQRMPSIITSGSQWQRYMRRRPITYAQGTEYKRRMEGSGAIITLVSTTPQMTIRAGNLNTDPDVTLVGADAELFPLRTYQIAQGRALLNADVEHSRMVAVIGNDVRNDLFPGDPYPVGKEIQIRNHRFRVVGVLASKGGVFGQSQDNIVIIPISVYVRTYSEEWSYSITIFAKAHSEFHMDQILDESIGVLRSIRNVRPGQDNDFEIEALSSLAVQIGGFFRFVGMFGVFCGIIALIAAGVGIMNIMLISVKERTREIGLRKALGATTRSILWQFLVESVLLCQLGAGIGVAAGSLLSSVLSNVAGVEIQLPFWWAATSVLLCTIVGVGFGAYPAWKAARLSPIEALRYE